MSDPTEPGRKLDLSLPAYTFQSRLDRISNWLENSSKTEVLWLLPETKIIQRVRAALGADIANVPDEDIAVQIRAWAERNHSPLGNQLPPQTPTTGDPDWLARFKRLVTSIPGSVGCRFDQGSASLSISGLTASLRTGKAELSVSRGWDGAIQFKTEVPNAVFTASLSPQEWKLTFTLGNLAPSISDLESVFKKGEAALRGVLAEVDKINWRDAAKTKDRFEPYLDPLKAAVDAAAKAAAQKPGSVNLGLWASGDVPAAPSDTRHGVVLGLRLTVLF
jgi:hypothetical protein